MIPAWPQVGGMSIAKSRHLRLVGYVGSSGAFVEPQVACGDWRLEAMNTHPRVDNRVAFAVFAIIAGLASGLLLASVSAPAELPKDLLSYFIAHRSTYLFAAVTVLVWATASVPFVVSLGALLGTREGTLALAATFLSTGGVLLLGFATFAFIGAFLAVTAASQAAPNQAEAIYQAAIWGNLSFFLADPGLMALGLGQFLFARLAWKSRLFPRLVCAIGYLGGLAGLFTLAVYQTSALAIVQIGSLGVWGIATGIVLFKQRDGLDEQPATQR